MRELLLATAASLEASGAPDEALGVRRAGRGVGPFRSAESMVPVGRAWRLGVLLLGRDGSLAATGSITRAVTPTRAQNLSGQVERRRADRLAASRGSFEEGEVVNFGYSAVAVDAASLEAGAGVVSVAADGTLLVRWGTTDAERRPLADYLRDRAALLLETP
ncbi:hypothetical protein C8E83_1504 [Frondihabitans australicus]|uniref:Glutaminase n=1 Tax=Frondihabitans australicus TaxID=386892 RepID=A0A495IEI4_9MICO|nr:hypothetical protein C8E83_1504 [Frondihabitans australicus]